MSNALGSSAPPCQPFNILIARPKTRRTIDRVCFVSSHPTKRMLRLVHAVVDNIPYG